MTKLAIDKIHCGDCLETMRQWPDGSVNCCVTSPPYWGLRDYGVDGQLGLEKTPEEYVAKMVEIFREVKRVLRDDGTLWLNLGDSYTGGGRGAYCDDGSKQATSKGSLATASKSDCFRNPNGLPAKNLVGIPWRVAFALQADGWYLRQDIIWHKPNPMPESVRDRCTKAHEYIFLLSKSARYYYEHEAIKEPGKNPQDDIRRISQQSDANKSVPTNHRAGLRPRKTDKQRGHARRHDGFNDRWDNMSRAEQGSLGRNKRDVWSVATIPYSDAHFATFPPKLIEPCILAGCPPEGVVLDPFIGAGTTGMVARKHNRHYIGCELNPEYVAMAEARIRKTTELPLFDFTGAAQ